MSKNNLVVVTVRQRTALKELLSKVKESSAEAFKKWCNDLRVNPTHRTEYIQALAHFTPDEMWELLHGNYTLESSPTNRAMEYYLRLPSHQKVVVDRFMHSLGTTVLEIEEGKVIWVRSEDQEQEQPEGNTPQIVNNFITCGCHNGCPKCANRCGECGKLKRVVGSGRGIRR